MKKIILCLALAFLWSCASFKYDVDKFSIGEDVELTSINATSSVRERDGQMFVQIRGVSADDQTIYYRVDWFDHNDMKLSTLLSGWKKVNLRENAEFIWKVTSPSKRAVSYRVYITDDLGNGLFD